MANLKGMLVVGGLVAVLGSGCVDNDVSKVGVIINLTKPKGCETVQNFSLDYGVYNLRCEENGKSVYYFRASDNDRWTKVIFEDQGGN